MTRSTLARILKLAVGLAPCHMCGGSGEIRRNDPCRVCGGTGQCGG